MSPPSDECPERADADSGWRRRKHLVDAPDGLLARLVARLPVPIHGKLLAAFAVMVLLLVAIGAVGLQVLGEANHRVEALASLQHKVAVYRGLQGNNRQLKQLLGEQFGGDINEIFSSGPTPVPALSNESVALTLRRLRQAYDVGHLEFVPTAAERTTLSRITADYGRFVTAMDTVLELHRAGKTIEAQKLQFNQARPIMDQIEGLTDRLANKAESDTLTLTNQNRSAYQNSRRVFVGVALGGAGLALLLGFAFSWSIIGPVRRVNDRLSEIAGGDFSTHVQLANRDELGELAVNLNTMNDELGRLYHDLETASRHKSEFLASMSHELRTPLNAIIGFSEVLRDQMFGPLNDRQADYLSDILSSGRHLLSLINDILDLSKIEAGKMELNVTTFSLPAVLENGLTMVRERATRHGITLGLDVAGDVSEVEADERKVKQILFNLLSNAVKFTPDGGRVDLRARQAGEAVQVAVADTGIGVDPADQVRIFEEFQQSGQQEGSGLGLPLSRSFVALHGGSMWMESEPGVGSTFTFTLPIRQIRPETVALAAHGVGATPEGPGMDGVAPTVLVVDDDPHSVELLMLYLEGAGFDVAVCWDGESGIKAAQRLRPAAIVLDITLPGLSGWDFLALAKDDEATAHIPVVIVSMLDERGRGFALGAVDYLVKPVNRDDLLATLRPLTVAGLNGGSCKVLAIDDDPMAVELIETVLSAEGFAVVGALSGEDGVRAAQAEHPGLIILDLFMPELDGFDVVERLRADPSTAQIPIVILTAKAIDAEDRERLAAHVAHLAAKASFSRAEFVDMVRRFCAHEVA